MAQKFKIGDPVELAQPNPTPEDKDREHIAFQGKVVGWTFDGKNYGYEVEVPRDGGPYRRMAQEKDLRKVAKK